LVSRNPAATVPSLVLTVIKQSENYFYLIRFE